MLVKHEFNCEFIGEFNPFSFLLIAIWGHFNAPHRGSTPLGGSVVNPYLVIPEKVYFEFYAAGIK